LKRRSLLAAPLAAFPLAAADNDDTRVFAVTDGLNLSPGEYAGVLAGLGEIAADDYSRGGIVARLEAKMAELLGKEAAIWMPTGTLANQVAVRTLATAGRRVIVQAESHLYNDSGDCSQTLSGLTLIPLAAGRGTFTVDEVQAAVGRSLTGRVVVPVAALQIETPVRRRHGEQFDFDQLQRISAWARSQKIGLHLDGARLFLESVYTGRPITRYTALFDTVYISMWKYFNAASGAILAGPRRIIDDMYHTRRMFGGGLPHAWPFAAVALRYIDGFEDRFRKAVDISERVISTLSRDPSFEIERVPTGTNIFHLRTPAVNGPTYRGRLEAAGISAPPDIDGGFFMQVNETWARVSAEEIAARFRRALG
jgi:threonine aldolase